MDLISNTARLGIYCLHEGSHVRCELESLQAAFALLETPLCALESAGVLPDRMTRGQLAAICHARGFSPSDAMTDNALRVAAKTILTGNFKTKATLEAYLAGLGCAVTLTQNPDGSFTAQGTLTGILLDRDGLARLLGQMLPAGTICALHLGAAV